MAERGRPRNFDRTEALSRAMELFWARGYEGASMADLTEAMGIGSPSLYAAFGSKEALFREAIEHYGVTEGPEIRAAMDAAPTARDAVEAYLTASARTFTRPGKPRGCMIVLSGLTPADASQSVCDALRSSRAGAVTDLERRLRRALTDGALPADFDVRGVAAFYVTVQQGMSIQARDGASRESLLAVARNAMAAWGALVGGSSGGEPERR